MGKDDKKLLIFAGLVLIFFVFIIFFFFSSGSFFGINPLGGKVQPVTSDTGLEVDTDPELIKEDKESSDVMSLLDKTPYYGENFVFSYNYDENYFTLYVNPANPSAGNAEFDKFLKQNGVESRRSIYDLRMVSVSPTP